MLAVNRFRVQASCPLMACIIRTSGQHVALQLASRPVHSHVKHHAEIGVKYYSKYNLLHTSSTGGTAPKQHPKFTHRAGSRCPH